MTRRRPYPSDITDAQWALIAPLIPTDRNLGRRRYTDMREIVNAINYRWQTGIVWRMLPHDFPPWATVYTYFRKWQRAGRLGSIRDVILRPKSSLPKVSAPDEKTAHSPETQPEKFSPPSFNKAGAPMPSNPPASTGDPYRPAEKKSQQEIPFPKERPGKDLGNDPKGDGHKTWEGGEGRNEQQKRLPISSWKSSNPDSPSMLVSNGTSSLLDR